MGAKEKKHVLTQEDIMDLLDSCYEKCLNGIPKVSPSVKNLSRIFTSPKNYDKMPKKGKRT